MPKIPKINAKTDRVKNAAAQGAAPSKAKGASEPSIYFARPIGFSHAQ